MPYISDTKTTLGLLQDRARLFEDRIFASYENQQLTVGQLRDLAEQTSSRLSECGVVAGDRVAVMLDNHLDNLILFFALLWVRAVHVPVNTRLRHDSLSYLIRHSEPKMVIAEQRYMEHLLSVDDPDQNYIYVEHREKRSFLWPNLTQSAQHNAQKTKPVAGSVRDVLFIMYTSGTTGPPKGVMVTDKMLRTAAFGCGKASDARFGDVFLVWEPLYHIGALQLVPVALEVGVELAIVGRFSATRFWDQVRELQATQIHFLGGILQMLLRQEVSTKDTSHTCRIAWGGGAPSKIADEFQRRFNVEVRENYGMTEASSLTSINEEGHIGSVGKPAPYFDVRIVDTEGVDKDIDQKGEIVVKELEKGLLTPGYFRNEEATSSTIRKGWLFTGDLGYFDQSGNLYYAGRVKDSIRRRGENISAWAIERVVEQLRFVEQAAAIGVPDELGDEAIKVFVKLAQAVQVESPVVSVHHWCLERLPDFQVPSYVVIIDEFPMTGTERIRKELLPTDTEGMEELSRK